MESPDLNVATWTLISFPRISIAARSRRCASAPTARASSVFGHIGTLAGSGALVMLTKGSLLLVPTMALHGAVLIFLFAPLHETIHRTAFRSRWLNDTVAFFCGLPLLLPPEYFRAFHFAHHRYTQDPARDPELAGGGRPASRGAWLLHLTGFPYWTWQARVLARHAFGRVNEPFLTPAAGRRVVREARVVIAAMARSLRHLWHRARRCCCCSGSVRLCLGSRGCAPFWLQSTCSAQNYRIWRSTPGLPLPRAWFVSTAGI